MQQPRRRVPGEPGGLPQPSTSSDTPANAAASHPHHLANFTSRDSGFGEVTPAPTTANADEMALQQDGACASLDFDYSEVRLAPATRTSVVTTTTTTTVHFAPILIPRSRRATRPSAAGGSAREEGASGKERASSFAQFVEREEARSGESSSRKLDPKLFPLSQVPWPSGISQFKLQLGAQPATFHMQPEMEMEEDRGGITPKRSDKGKGRENDTIFNFDPSTIPSTPNPSTATHAQLNRAERGLNALRRRSRTSQFKRGPLATHAFNSSSAADDPYEEGEDDEDEEHDGRPEASRMEGIIATPDVLGKGSVLKGARSVSSPGPPRKRPRSTSDTWRTQQRSVESTGGITSPVAIPTPLHPVASTPLVRPTPGPPSPVPTHSGDDDFDSSTRAEETLHLGSGRELSGLLALPDFLEMFDQLTPALQSYFIFTFLKRSSVPVLQTINNIIAPSLRRDFLADLPPELGVQVLGFLDAKSLCRAATVCKGWNRLVDGEWRVWKDRLDADGLWVGDGSDERESLELVNGSKDALFLRRWKAGVWSDEQNGKWNNDSDSEGMQLDQLDAPSPAPSLRRFSNTQSINLGSPSSSREASPPPTVHYIHPFKSLYRRRFLTRRNWIENEPARVTFAANGNSVVTCLQFDQDKIVSASDDHSINVFDTRTGSVLARLDGHEGGVWALQYIGNILVSGSTDRTVRVWDLSTGKCTHVFVGHTSTVRCLQIVQPENINPDPNGEPIWEPPCPLIVTGSRDWSLRVWKLPAPGEDVEYHPVVPMSPSDENTDVDGNPFHLHHLAGHRHAVRALAAHGRTLVSGSYDTAVRVWDMITGKCLHQLRGHTQKVYSVVYDPLRKQCASGSMDGTVRLWSTETGECRATLEGHSSLVGLLGLSHRHLVSAAADSTLRIWDPETGNHRHTLAAHSGAITCFQHDEYKVVSGSDGTLKMWDARDGSFTRDLLTGLTGVWQVSFNERFCIAAVQRNGQSEFEILDFGSVEEETQGLSADGEGEHRVAGRFADDADDAEE